MIVALTGFHAAGKSYLAQVMAESLGWVHFHKQNQMKVFYEKQRLNHLNLPDWNSWQVKMFQENGHYEVMSWLLGGVRNDQILVVDSLHHPDEWKAVRDFDSRAILVGIFTPNTVRSVRRDEGEDELDAKRQSYWHDENHRRCLLSSVEWSFVGSLSREELERQCHALKGYLDSLE